MAPIAIMTLLGGAALIAAVSFSRKAGRSTITVNGRSWIVEKVGENVTVTAYLVKAPAKAFGPHIEMPVLQFSQQKAPPNERRLEAKFPDVPSGIFDAAATDFGVPISF